MRRKEANALIGTRVAAWTALNGIYVGTLLAIEAPAGQPWRGRVRIDGVLQVATHFQVGRGVTRRGYRAGEDIVVGGANIKPCAEPGVTYEEGLEQAIAKHQAWLSGPVRQDSGSLQAALDALRQTLADERERKVSGRWRDHRQDVDAIASAADSFQPSSRFEKPKTRP